MSGSITAGLAGRYTVERELGRGGMASIFLAHDLKHDRSVAPEVLHPERAAALGAERFLRDNRYRDHVVMWAKDMRRGIDYLETRADVTTDRLACYGVSWGGALGGLLPAGEPRIRVGVLVVAGLDLPRTRPEVDPLDFLPRIRTPTLMLNGRYDFSFPLESSQLPMVRLLGTPARDKRHVVEEGSQFLPRTRMIQETLDWLGRYQAVVE